MAKNSITDYSKTAASNTDIQSVDIAEGCLPSGINNAIREIMADLADMNDGTVTLTSPSFAAASLTGNLSFGDNDKAIFGAGSDLQIYHDGSDSYVRDAGTGYLNLLGTGRVVVGHPSNGHVYLNANYGGDVELFFNNSKKLETTSTGIDVTGTVTADGLTVDGVGSLTSSSTELLDLTSTGGDSLIRFGSLNSSFDVRIGSPSNPSTANGSFVVRTAGDDRLLVANNGDISFYEDTGTTAKLFWDASAESLGIGTTAPVRQIHSHQSSGGATNYALFTNTTTGSTSSDGIVVGLNATSDGYLWNYEAGNLVFGTSSTERMRIDSSGNTMLAKSSTNTLGTVGHDFGVTGYAMHTRASSNVLYLNRTTNDGNIAEFYKDGTTVGSIFSYNGFLGIGSPSGNDAYLLMGSDFVAPATSTGAARDNAIDLGSSSRRFKSLYLSSDLVLGAADGYVFGNTNGVNIRASSGKSTIFDTAGSERMRIDSGGNVLVGTTTSSTTVSGHSLLGGGADNGIARHIADGIEALQVGRINSDGVLVKFYKDGSTVGSIGVDYSSRLYIGTGDTGLFFNDLSDAVQPISPAGDLRGNAIDLGTAGTTFKDLYLGGGVYLGGTGSANKLDDYEEGTWTPTASLNVAAVSGANGHYTKVGNLVTITFEANADPTSTTANMQFEGLPFTVANHLSSTNVGATGVAYEDNSFFTLWASETTNKVIIELDRPLQGSASSISKNYRGTLTYFTS